LFVYLMTESNLTRVGAIRIKTSNCHPGGNRSLFGVPGVGVTVLKVEVLKAMFMKKIAVTTAVAMALSLVTFESLAGPWKKFENTPIQVERAKDIVIAECVSEISPGPRSGIAPCEAKVVAVIKGDRKVGKLTLLSDGLKRGRTYMLTNFGDYYDKFATDGELAVVELPPDFDLGSLKGKPPLEQVQAVFDARRSWLEGELQKLEAEKRLLDKSTPQKVE
jgi:hypothetical protein